MRGVDTNVLLRILLRDDPVQSPKARAYVVSHARAAPAFVNRITLCELAWVLRAAAGFERAAIADAIESLLTNTLLVLEDADLVQRALVEFRRTNADFADALIGQVNARAGCAKTATFDRDAAALPEFELIA